MSLGKRACYKCGNLGHFAETCTSDERLCYNCKQPGHESNACPQPRTSEAKQCYHCQGIGHVQSDCPSLRIARQHKMYVAGGRGGGFAGRGGIPSRGGFGGPGMGRGFMNGEEDGRLQTCYKCGGPNHFARDCHAKSVKCYACGKFEGHISRDCPYAAQNTTTDPSSVAPLPPPSPVDP